MAAHGGLEGEEENLQVALLHELGWLLHVPVVEIIANLAVFRIHDILEWIRIRIRGSIALKNGSGSWTIFLKHFFCLLLFEGTFTSFFKDKQ